MTLLILIGILIATIAILGTIILGVWYLKTQIQEYAFFITDTNEDKLQVSEANIQEMGYVLSEIINQSGEDLTDGECLDEVIAYLKRHNLFHESTE